MSKIVALLIIPIVIGQLLKIPLGTNGGLSILDCTVLAIDILGLIHLKFHLKKAPKLIILSLVFIVVAMLSLLFTPLKLTFLEYATSSFYIIRLASFILLGWLIYSGAFGNFKKQISAVLLYSGVILAVLGILQIIFIPNLQFLVSDGWDPHYLRLVSTLLDPNFVGSFLVLTLILLFTNISGLKPKIQILLFSIVYLATILTFSRSAAIMFVASFAFVALLKHSVKLIALVILLSLGFFISFKIYDFTIAKPNNIDRQKSAEYRLGSWGQGKKIFQNAPILGIGFNSYRYALREFNLTDESVIQGRGGSANDSSLLFIAATTGIIGIISYLSILLALLKVSFTNFLKNNTWGLIMISATIGLIIDSFFINNLFYPWTLLWITLAASNLE